MQPQDIELEPLSQALGSLDEALAATRRPPLPELRQLLRDATIQRFEFSFEMSWNALRRVLLALGIARLVQARAVSFAWGGKRGSWTMLRPGSLTLRHATSPRTFTTTLAWSSFCKSSMRLRQPLKNC